MIARPRMEAWHRRVGEAGAVALMAAALATAPAPAAAAAPAEEYSPAKRRQVVADFASCVIRRHPQRASQAVLQQLNNDEIIRRQGRLIDSFCVLRDPQGRLTVRLPGPLMRYALADALVRSNPTVRVTNPPSIARLDHRNIAEADYRPRPGRRFKPQEAEEKAKSRDEALVHVALSRFGECVVRVSPNAADSLVRSPVYSAAEQVAYRALATATCLQEGQKVEFSRDVLRGTVAMNYYRLAHAPRVSVPSQGSAR